MSNKWVSLKNSIYLEVGDLRLHVHHTRAKPDIWFVSCDSVGIRSKPLQSQELSIAKREAINLLRRKLRAQYINVWYAWADEHNINAKVSLTE